MITRVYYRIIIWEKYKCLLVVLAKLLYLDRVGRADFSGCHLEEIWLFATGLFHLNGNVRKRACHCIGYINIGYGLKHLYRRILRSLRDYV